jgi:two-component system chemotaxis response regulator CheY
MESISLKVLICDDSMLIRKKLHDCLQSFCCNDVLEASNGQEAIDIYKFNNPDLVFMDMIMPIKNGIEAVTEIVQFDPSARVVILSTVGTKANLKKALEAGACDFIQKTYEDQQIKAVLDKLIERGK